MLEAVIHARMRVTGRRRRQALFYIVIDQRVRFKKERNPWRVKMEDARWMMRDANFPNEIWRSLECFPKRFSAFLIVLS